MEQAGELLLGKAGIAVMLPHIGDELGADLLRGHLILPPQFAADQIHCARQIVPRPGPVSRGEDLAKLLPGIGNLQLHVGSRAKQRLQDQHGRPAAVLPVQGAAQVFLPELLQNFPGPVLASQLQLVNQLELHLQRIIIRGLRLILLAVAARLLIGFPNAAQALLGQPAGEPHILAKM